MIAGTAFGGLAVGTPDESEQDIRQHRLAFEQQLEARVTPRAREQADWQHDQHTLCQLDNFSDDLRRQAAIDPDADVPPRRRYYGQAQEAIGNARRNIWAKRGGPLLQRWARRAQDVAQRLGSAAAGVQEIEPNELSAAYAYHTGHDPQALTPQNEVVRAAQAVLQAGQSGNIASAIPALNQLYANDLAGYVGIVMHDGSRIAAPPRIVAAHPNPNDPSQTVFVAQYRVVHPDGRAGTLTAPLMLHGQHIAIHPEDGGDNAVLSMDTGEFIHHTLGLASTILTALHPGVQARLQQADARQGARNRFLLELSTRLGTREAHAPRAQAQVSEHGIIERDPQTGGITRVVPMPAPAGLHGPGPVPVSSPAEAARLPSGTLFRTPDGRTIRRH